MTSKRTPQRGNADIGKDGVRNPGRFAPTKTVADDPSIRTQRLKLGDETGRLAEVLDENRRVDLTRLSDSPLDPAYLDIKGIILETFEQNGSHLPPIHIGAYILTIRAGWETKDGYCPIYQATPPETWLELSDDDHEDIIDDPDHYAQKIVEKREEWIMSAAEEAVQQFAQDSSRVLERHKGTLRRRAEQLKTNLEKAGLTIEDAQGMRRKGGADPYGPMRQTLKGKYGIKTDSTTSKEGVTVFDNKIVAWGTPFKDGKSIVINL